MSFLSYKKHQTGAAAAISIFILLVIIAGMLTTALYSSSSSISSSVQQQGHQKALFLAETGIQVAQYEMDKANQCSDVSIGTTNYGSGSYEITTSVSNAVTGGCDVTVIGKSNGIVSTFMKTMLFSGGAVATGFLEEFTPDVTDFNNNWAGKFVGKPGLAIVGWDIANHGGSAGGSMVVNVVPQSTKKLKAVTGDMQRALTNVIDATAGDVTVTLTMAVMSSDDTASGTPNANQNFSVTLTSSSLGAKGDLLVWDSTGTGVIDNTGVWYSPSPSTTFVVTQGANVIYDGIQLDFDITPAAKNEDTYIFVDDIDLSW